MTHLGCGAYAAGPLPPSNAPWVVEVGGWIAFGLVAVFLLYRWRKNGRPDIAALLFIGCFTMWWQEFYADWGAYLYYNSDLVLLPWGQTPYTTPNKPVYVLAGYGWFYAGGFAAVLALFRSFRRRYSSVNYIAALVITVFLPFILRNFVTADGVSYVTNWFQYPISNVPGPRQFGRIASAPLTKIYSVGPLTFGVGVNITAWSYVDQLNISVLADDATVEDPHEVTEAMVAAFALIRQAAERAVKVVPQRTLSPGPTQAFASTGGLMAAGSGLAIGRPMKRRALSPMKS